MHGMQALNCSWNCVLPANIATQARNVAGLFEACAHRKWCKTVCAMNVAGLFEACVHSKRCQTRARDE